jgi:fructan beta-fructosidase
MSNWQYGTLVPTQKWRSAMTVPRDLTIEKLDEKYWLRSRPVPELDKLATQPVILENITTGNLDLTTKTGKLTGPARLDVSSEKIANFTITLSNALGQKAVIGYDKGANTYFIDRTVSGKTDFEKGFAARHSAPRLSHKDNVDLTLLIDNASVELFADHGLSVMTSIFFPDSNYSDLTIQSPEGFTIKSLRYSKLKTIFEASSVAIH